MAKRAVGNVRALLAAVALFGLGSAASAAVDLFFIPRVEAEFAKGKSEIAFTMLEDAIRDPATAAEDRIDLLADLARRRLSYGYFADAGEALALQAELTARIEGPQAPELAGLSASAADAYLKADDAGKALDLAIQAVRVDRIYVDCASEVLARDHQRLADVLDRLGRAEESASEAKLATDSGARCADAKAHVRGITITNDLGDADANSFARVNIFYATDRVPTGSVRPEEFFGGERGTLAYGNVVVTVPRIHKPGAIEAPSLMRFEWSENAERHFVLASLSTMDEAEMLADIRSHLEEHKSDAIFVFIHGYNVSFADAAKRTAQMAYDLNFDGAPVLYSWPSRASTLSYIADETAVRLSGRHLRGFLEDLVSQSGAKHIYLLAHSMGNRALLDALELMSTERNADGVQPPLFDEVIFAAPDEDAALFSEMIKTIRPIARRLTLYGSANDLALSTSRQVHGDQPRAGEGGTSMLVAGGVDSIDMSTLGEDMLGHSYFAASTSALTDIFWLFWRDTPPAGRCGMETKAAPAGNFWLFDPARCDGPVVLSALTMLKNEGSNALAKLDEIVARIQGDPDKKREAAEWNAIRKVLSNAISAQ